MKTSYSTSLMLVWRVAEFEARHAKASTIEPPHLLLGLCKVVDLDLPEFISKDSPDRNEILEEMLREARKLKTVFRDAGLNAKTFRRKLRQSLPEPRFSLEDSKRLRRSSAAKKIFADAEHYAQLSSGVVYPTHLLYSVLLAQDEHRDATLAELNIKKTQFLTLSKREVLEKQIDSASSSTKARTRWN